MTPVDERLVELINLASIEVDANKKVEYLYQIKELTLNHGLIDNFFQDILAFQNERSPNVKKFVLAFIEAALKHDCKLCPKAILSLNLLLNDTNTEVIKRSIQAATQFYRALVLWIVTSTNPKLKGSSSSNNNNASGGQPSPLSPKQQQQQHNPPTQQQLPQPSQLSPHDEVQSIDTSAVNLTGEIEKTWLMWLQIENFICILLEATNNDGIRTHCIKFIETIIVMQTPRDKFTDQSHELNLVDSTTSPIELSNEAMMCGLNGIPKGGVIFNEEHKLELVELAKTKFEQLIVFHGTSHISSVNLMAAMQSLVVLAKQRYRLFMGRVIQAMEALHNRLPPTLTESQVQSVKKFMKLQLTVMLKHPYSLDRFQHQIIQLLQAVGSRQPEIHRAINDFKNKFGSDSTVVNSSNIDAQKRIKLETGMKPTPNLQAGYASQAMVGKSKHLDLNKLTQELDEKEKRQIVVDSVRRILDEEKKIYILPAQMDIKKKVLSTLANEFHNTECPTIIQDYIFGDLRNRHEICYAIIRKNFEVALTKAAKRQINLFDSQELLKNYFDCFNSYLNRAMELKDTKERDIILPNLYSLREEYYRLSNQDQEQDDK